MGTRFPVAAQQAGNGSGAEREANRIQNLLAGKAEGEVFSGKHGGRMGGHSGLGMKVSESMGFH